MEEQEHHENTPDYREEEKKRVLKTPPSRFRRKTCRFCENKDLPIDYKRIDVLVKLVSNKGRILPRRLTGTCAKHQRAVAKAIKRARMAGLMPFSVT